MTRTLRESKAQLAKLVEAASRGEEVIITVGGQPKARLVAVEKPKIDFKAWARELREMREKHSTGRRGQTVDEIIDELREERN
jgi:prevent-host-death family protein